jgi:hypothetical protein
MPEHVRVILDTQIEIRMFLPYQGESVPDGKKILSSESLHDR